MALFESFLGPSYAAESQAAACDRTANYLFEAIELPFNSKTRAALFQRPGSTPFGTFPNPYPYPARGALAYDGNNVPNGAIFGVSGAIFWQLNADGGITNWGTVANDDRQARFAANSASVGQVAVASGGELYILASGVFTHIVNDGINFFGARDVCFIDGYFLVLSDTANAQQFQISAINDGLTWNGIDVGLLEGQADPIERCIVNVEYVYFIGLRRGEIWYNSGNALFPFTIQPGAFLEVGTNAPDSVIQSAGLGGGRIYYTGQDARGENIAVVIDGLSADTISQPAVSAEWATYSTTDDCLCYPYTWKGHALIRYIFPTADKGWEYDITESSRTGIKIWNEVSFTDAQGVQHAPYERAHAYGIFNRHILVSGGADGNPGQIYDSRSDVYEDCAGLNWLSPIQQDGFGFMVSGCTDTDTVIEFFGLSFFPVALGYILVGPIPGGGEIMQITAFTPIIGGVSTFTVVRGFGGTLAQAWPADTVVAPATFAGFPITRDRVVRLPWNNGLFSFIDRLEFFINAGNGNEADPGLNPIMILSIAREFGPNGPIFGEDYEIPMGQIGQYQLRLFKNRLGKYRDGAIRIRITEPVFAALVGCQHYLRKGLA